jgi:hypothetical protein
VDRWAADGPGIRGRRYEVLTESEQQRKVWYLVRRHLGLSVEQWEALPWHVQLVYLEGLATEFYDPDHDTEDYDDTETLSGVEAEGIQVRRITA